ncbi:MAG: hypothetical protein RBU21_10550 [FCB group bacterium]|nr:hypothetical protein [FCB group bacterium]
MSNIARFKILGATIHVLSNSRALLAPIEEKYAPYLLPPVEPGPGNSDLECRIELLEDEDDRVVRLDGGAVRYGKHLSWPQPDDIFMLGLRKLLPHMAFVHASSVVEEGKAALFVGASHHGKTTLACALAQDGGRLFSDDLTPVDLRTGRVHPLLAAPRLRAYTQDMARRYGWRPLVHTTAPRQTEEGAIPALIFFLRAATAEKRRASEASIRRMEQEAQAHRDLDSLFFRAAPAGDPPPVRSWYRPRPDFKTEPLLEECAPSIGARNLLNHMYQPQYGFAEIVSNTAKMVSRARTYHLVPGELEPTAAVVRRVMREHTFSRP